MPSSASRPSCNAFSERRANGRNVVPISVSRTPRPFRSNSASPRSRSSDWMRAVTDGCVRKSASAALLKLRCCATCTNASICPRSNGQPAWSMAPEGQLRHPRSRAPLSAASIEALVSHRTCSIARGQQPQPLHYGFEAEFAPAAPLRATPAATGGAVLKTDYAGDLSADAAGREVVIAGWVHRRRDHGGLIFLDLRDSTRPRAGRVPPRPGGGPRHRPARCAASTSCR